MRLPARLVDSVTAEPGGADWLLQLPTLVERAVERWSLRLGEPFPWSNYSLAVPAGDDAVLKLNFPDRESRHEGEALAHYDGRGAVRLLAHEPADRALLLERCRPGTQLWELRDDVEATRAAARVLARLWRPAPPQHPFRTLTAESLRWADELPRIAGLARELAATQGELVVCHQDFHGGNLLRARREPWLAIDPKPLVGEREFDTASLIRDRRETISAPVIRRRLDVLEAELGLDRERMHGWALVHAAAWGHPSVVELLRGLGRGVG